ncbi:MAG: leucyl aminopeptidase [Parvibaculaceae bacterium]
MPMKTKFAAPSLPTVGSLVLLVGESGALGPLGEAADRDCGGRLKRAMKIARFDGKRDQCLDVAAPDSNERLRIFLYGVGNVAKLGALDLELVGGGIAGALQAAKAGEAAVAVELPGKAASSAGEAAARIASGMRLRTYSFDKYKSKKKDDAPRLATATILTEQAGEARKAFRALDGIADAVHLARDLVNEPANVLYPEEFARRARELQKSGVDVTVLEPKQMQKLGMRALLGVAQGSARPARLVVMRWNGGPKGGQPVAFVGKGVTFDTGGISIKPAQGMEDMKGDMGGAAAVTGLMAALATRKARANVVGVIGLVENMPDGNAQRPGDVVTSMSGQTISILNTDAEGRLVLADALWYTQKQFKPRFMVSLATLTGAIIVALGKEHAGLFSNNDELAERLFAAGKATGEKVWRMPLSPEYDKIIDSDIADVKNTGGRNAGAITAAQFVQRFVNDLPWAHLDIAGTAMDSVKNAINQSWGSGWGVRLLNRLVEDHYEK